MYLVQQWGSVSGIWMNLGNKEKSLAEAEAIYKSKIDDKDNIVKYGHRYRIVELVVIKVSGWD